MFDFVTVGFDKDLAFLKAFKYNIGVSKYSQPLGH